MEFLNDVSVVQWAFLGLGAVLVLPLVWDSIKDKIPSWNDVKPAPSPKSPPSLSKIVRQWETLLESCEDRRLHDACSKLDEVFPLLISAREDEVETDDE
jgi:hypothetical protein